MIEGKVWVNQEIRKKKRMKARGISGNRVKKEQGSSQQPKGKEVSNHQTVGTNQATNIPSFLDTLSQLTKSVDLVKLKNQISDLNQVFEQVNGMIQNINQLNRPKSYPKGQSHPQNQGNQHQAQNSPIPHPPGFYPPQMYRHPYSGSINYHSSYYQTHQPYYPYHSQHQKGER